MVEKSEVSMTANPYPAFCRRYATEDCIRRCRHYMQDELYFCRAYNRKFFGQPVVEVSVIETPKRKNWWDKQAELMQ